MNSVAAHKPTSKGKKKKRRRGRKVLILAWAVIWPAIGFAFSGIGNLIVDRYGPPVVNSAGNSLGFGPINTVTDWPGDLCDGADVGAFPDPAPDERDFLSGRTNLSGEWVRTLASVGGSSYRTGTLRVTITSKADQTLVVSSIQVLKYEPPRQSLAWIVHPYSQCGGGDADVRTYNLTLDDSRNPIRELDSRGKALPVGSFQQFEASATDPTVLRFNVAACSSNYSFGIRIKYSVAGQEYSADVGTADTPFRIAGVTPSSTTRAYKEVPGDDAVWQTVTPSQSEFEPLTSRCG